MKARTELLLYQLSWTAGRIMRPGWYSVLDSFEGWAYRNGLLRQVRELEARALLESQGVDDAPGKRVHRLTRLGHLRALGGVDPRDEWSKPWDGTWRMAVFDLSERERSLRLKLRRALVRSRFGCLQKSVWISPRPLEEVRAEIESLKADAAQLVFFAGTTCCGEKPRDLVSAAWDFSRINATWAELESHLRGAPSKADPGNAPRVLSWAEREWELWKRCVARDPFLPEELWPTGYPGRRVWDQRLDVLAKIGKTMEKWHHGGQSPATS